MLGHGERLADLAPGVGEELQRARRRHPRVELAERPRGEVARIGEHGLAHLRLAGVQRREIGGPHVDLAARLEDFWRAGQPPGDGRDRADVGGDVLALVAVAAGRRLHERPVLVAQRARQAVDLGLGGHGERGLVRKPEKAAHPGAELADLLVGENVGERQHGHGVPTLANFSDGAAPTRAESEFVPASSGKVASSAR